MHKHLSVAALLATVFLNGCTGGETDKNTTNNVLVFTSFENLDGWLADSPALATLTQEKAHTGVYSTKISPGHDYSIGYSNELSKLSPDWPGKIIVSGWVFLPSDQATVKLVTEVKTKAGVNIVWQGLEVNKAVKGFSKWQYVEQEVNLPDSAKPNSRILVYLWLADSKEPVYLDDLKIALATQ